MQPGCERASSWSVPWLGWSCTVGGEDRARIRLEIRLTRQPRDVVAAQMVAHERQGRLQWQLAARELFDDGVELAALVGLGAAAEVAGQVLQHVDVARARRRVAERGHEG